MKFRTGFCGILYLVVLYELAANGIGYGSSTAIVTSRIQEGFLMGFRFGLQSVLKKDEVQQLLTINQVADGSQLGAIKSAVELIDKKVSVLTGFPGSHDAILAASVARSAGIMGIFVGANHNKLSELGPDIYTTGHSMNTEVLSILKFVEKKFPRQRGLVVFNSTAVASISQEVIFKQLLGTKEFSGLNLNLRRLNASFVLDESDLKELKLKKVDYLILTPYPEAAVSLTEQLIQYSLDVPIVSGSAWGTVDSDVMRRFISTKKAPFYMAVSWLKGLKTSAGIEKAFRFSFGRDPTPDNMFGYDLGRIIGTIAKRTKKPISGQTFKKAFNLDTCFSGLSIGKLCFGPGGGHSDRKVNFVKYTPKGFEFVD